MNVCQVSLQTTANMSRKGHQ